MCRDIERSLSYQSHVYRQFGSRTLRTTVGLATLAPAVPTADGNLIYIVASPSGPPDDIHWRHHWRDGAEIVLSLATSGRDYWLRVPELADFLVQLNPCRIQVAPSASGLDDATLEHLLVDQILPRLMSHQGELLVHASLLEISGRHALFLGPSGFGKSTLAGLMQRHGHRVLSDDCVQLVWQGDRPAAIATYPSLRLNKDSLEAVCPGNGDTTPMASYSEKRRVPLAPDPDAAAPRSIAAMYLLGDPESEGDGIQFTPLRPAQSCLALIRHSFRLDLGDREANAGQLARCGDIARRVSAFQLDYRRDFAQQRALVEAVTAHLGQLPAPH